MTTTTTTRPTFAPLAGLPRPGIPRLVAIPGRRCLQVDGEGEPGNEAFQRAIGALYGTSYTLHFALKKAGRSARIPALEGLWKRTDGTPLLPTTDHPADPAAWRWTLLMEIPPEATDAEVEAAIEAARTKRPNVAFDRLRVGWLEAATVVEAMHVGPYATEPATIGQMHETMRDAGLRPVGRHHEIYLGDPRRSAPERLRTILRQGVEPEG
jgi:hypothetical protein